MTLTRGWWPRALLVLALLGPAALGRADPLVLARVTRPDARPSYLTAYVEGYDRAAGGSRAIRLVALAQRRTE